MKNYIITSDIRIKLLSFYSIFKEKYFLITENHRIINISFFLVFSLLIYYSIICISLWFDINIWRHDSAYYSTDFRGNLVMEGRWLTYLFFHILKTIPAHFCIIVSYAILFLFFINAQTPFVMQNLQSFSGSLDFRYRRYMICLDGQRL